MAEVYWGCFERSGETVPPAPEAVSAPGAVHLPPHWSASPVCGAGSGFEAYEALSSRLQLTPVWGRLRPRALEVARLAALDGLATAVPPDAAEPVYLRNDVATPQS
jgi:tRNA A37 threonylcarbamoyladenosine modification protein TsaB